MTESSLHYPQQSSPKIGAIIPVKLQVQRASLASSRFGNAFDRLVFPDICSTEVYSWVARVVVGFKA